jgi:hypothetical protein
LNGAATYGASGAFLGMSAANAADAATTTASAAVPNKAIFFMLPFPYYAARFMQLMS